MARTYVIKRLVPTQYGLHASHPRNTVDMARISQISLHGYAW